MVSHLCQTQLRADVLQVFVMLVVVQTRPVMVRLKLERLSRIVR